MTLKGRILKFLFLSLLLQVFVLVCFGFYVIKLSDGGLPDSTVKNLTSIDKKVLEGVALQHAIGNEMARNLIAYELLELNKVDNVQFIDGDSIDKLIKKMDMDCSLVISGANICSNKGVGQAFSFVPVKMNDRTLGFLKLTKSMNSSIVTSKDVGLILSAILVTFLLNVIFVFIFWLRDLKGDLEKIISVIRNGKFDATIQTQEYQEIQNRILLSFQKNKEADQERIKFERALAKDSIAKQVVHDIKSPLTSLEYLIKNTRSKLAENERLLANQSLERINDILNTLNSPSAEMNNNSISHAGKIKTPANTTNKKAEIIDPLIKRIIAEKRLEFKTKNNIEIKLENNAPYGTFVNLNKANFYRAISNLINNCAEACIEGRKLSIHLKVSTLGASCMIEIRDNGKGISKDATQKVVERGVSIGKESGSGIGLSSAKECIESLGGSLRLMSEQNVGTVVTLTLPITTAPKWFQTSLVIEKSKVCIVDDDESIHSLWDEILDGTGLQIFHFQLADEFEKWMQNAKDENNVGDYAYLFDLELLGSQSNGLDLIDKYSIKQNSTLVTSHYDDPAIQQRAEAMGVKIIPKDSADCIPIELSQGQCEAVAQGKDIVLIDDDPLVHQTWQMAAQLDGVNLKSYYCIDSFLQDAERVDRKTTIYIDSMLQNGRRGEREAKRIYLRGFRQLILASGHKFEQLPAWIVGQQDKSFPLS